MLAGTLAQFARRARRLVGLFLRLFLLEHVNLVFGEIARLEHDDLGSLVVAVFAVGRVVLDYGGCSPLATYEKELEVT